MKKSILSFNLILLGIFALSAQNFQEVVKVGDNLIIAAKENNQYEHIDIPRKNFIIKKGGIADMTSIHNKRTIVKSIREKNGSFEVVLKPESGKFFMAYNTLKADLNKAIESGELIIPQSKKGSKRLSK